MPPLSRFSLQFLCIRPFFTFTYAFFKSSLVGCPPAECPGPSPPLAPPLCTPVVLTLIYRSHIGHDPRYLRDFIRLPSSAISLRPVYAHLTVVISLSRKRGLLWLRHWPSQ